MSEQAKAGGPLCRLEPVVGRRYTSQEMLKLRLPPGGWVENIAPLGRKPSWVLKAAP